MKLTITKTFGNFSVTATTQVDGLDGKNAVAEELIRAGLLYIFERNPSTSVEQKVFAPMLGWEMNEKGTTYKRPTGFNRNSVPYSPSLGVQISAAYESSPGKLKVDGESIDIDFVIDSIVENESDGGASRKMATEMEAKLDAGMELALGITKEDDTAARVEKCHKFLATLRKGKK